MDSTLRLVPSHSTQTRRVTPANPALQLSGASVATLPVAPAAERQYR
jgi:hypothetical protein